MISKRFDIELADDEIKIVIDLLKYIQKYPQAKHTKEGIAKQWLVQQRLEEEMDKVLKVIDYLQQEEIIQAIKNNTSSYFRINEEKKEKMAFLLNSLSAKTK